MWVLSRDNRRLQSIAGPYLIYDFPLDLLLAFAARCTASVENDAAVAFGYISDSTSNGGLTSETCTRQEASPCFTMPLDSLHVTSTSSYAVSMASCSPQAGVLLSIEHPFDLVTESDASFAQWAGGGRDSVWE